MIVRLGNPRAGSRRLQGMERIPWLGGAAVTVVLLAALAGCARDVTRPPDPASPDRGVVEQTASAPAPGDLVLGEPPARPWVHDLTLHRPDGTTLRLRAGRDVRRTMVSAVLAHRDGYAVSYAPFEGSVGLVLLDRDGRRVETPRHCHTDPVASTDGRTIAFGTFDCPETGEPGPPPTLVRSGPDGVEAQRLPPTHLYPRVVGLDGDRAVYSFGFGSGGTWIERPGAAPRRLSTAAPVLVAEREGVILAQPRPRRVAGLDLDTGRVLWTRPGHAVSLEPSERRVLVDRGGPRAHLVLDVRSGDLVTTVDAHSRLGPDVAVVLEDARHAIGWVPADEGRRWRAVRLGADGLAEAATPWLEGDQPVFVGGR